MTAGASTDAKTDASTGTTDASADRRRGRIVGLSLAVALAIVAVATVASAAAEDGPIGTAVDETALTETARALADQVAVIAGGGLLIGIGVGAAVASGVTYWYKNRQIGGKLR